MKKQEFEVEIVRVLSPGESYTVLLPDDGDEGPNYENLRILEEHFASAQRMQPGDRVTFTGALIQISGSDININTKMIVTQSDITVLHDELTSLTCKIKEIIFDNNTGQLYTAKVMGSTPQLDLTYINIMPTNILMKGIQIGTVIWAKGIYHSASLYTPSKRHTTVPLFLIKQFRLSE